MKERKIEVLDHGYVGLVETWGSDERVIEAARMSTGKGFQGWGPACEKCGNQVLDSEAGNACPFCTGTLKAGDEKLLAFLWQNQHATPFEMAGAIFEVQAPIFVFREWHRHRTQSYNEMSARYTPLPDVNYVPSVERLMMNAGGSNKQAGTIAGAKALCEEDAIGFQALLVQHNTAAELIYQDALQSGVPKELARVCLPVARYSRMRASANLRNWLAFEALRLAPNAQWEIRQYAEAVGKFLAHAFPRTWALFEKGCKP